jgi:tubulin-specific chaperone B
VGKVAEYAAGWWVGVMFDEPLGKGDGCAKGKRYYDCQAGFGSFVRPDMVKVGDYPPLEDDLCSEDEL